ncbi:MAG: small ribosomal subunit biogenesis GTPase RsgA [Tatlockia sp.]|nr:small ribosomal subunit biogenesis GTPase RsgA [Tatlockia sp.]
MSKRRINKQQSARIQKIQANYRQKNEFNDSLERKDGLVLSRYSRHADIEDSQGNRIHCSIRPNIDSLVAGDRVIWQVEGGKKGIVVSRYPRKTMLGRPDKRGEFKPVAANITQVIVVLAAKPELSWFLLDSYLVMIELLGDLNVCIVLNKMDLNSVDLQRELVACYEPLGYQIIFTSTLNNFGFELLKETLNHQVSVFVGQSGVGKSSLISGLLPHESNIQTAEISVNSNLGCHTTSNSRYYHLPSGGALIDSPGVREIGLWHLPVGEITHGYPEFRPLISGCKFRNCNHINSPNCAITKALSEGKLTQKRYDNYLKIISLFGK